MHPIFIQIAIFALSAAMGIIYVVNQVTNDSDSHVSDNATRATLFVLVGIILLIFNRSKTIAASLSTDSKKVSMLPIFFSSFMIVLCAAFFGMVTCYSYYISGSGNYNMAVGFIIGATLLSIFFSSRQDVFDKYGVILVLAIAGFILTSGIYLDKAYGDLDNGKSINPGMKSFFKDMYIMAITLSVFMIVGVIGIKGYMKYKESKSSQSSEAPKNEH